MQKMVVFGTVAILGCSLATLLSGAQERAGHDETTVEKSLPVRGAERVNVDVFIGTIHVYADSPDSVRVKAIRSVKGGAPADRQRWLKETRVDVEERDGALQIKDVVPEDLRRHPVQGDSRSDFDTHLNVDIHMPRHLALLATSTVGDVEVDGQAAELKVKSTAGNIRLKHLQCVGKSVDVRAGAGNIMLEGQVGNLTVTDGAGALDLSRMVCSGDRAEVQTGAGNINAGFTTLPGTRCSVDVGAGNVVMNLPAQVRATLQLTSGMGQVRSAFTSRSGQSSHRMGDTLTGDVNGGGTALDVHVGMGNISVEKAGGRDAQAPEAGDNSASRELRAHRSAPQDTAAAQDDDAKGKDVAADQAEKAAEAAAEVAEARAEREADAAEARAEREAERAEKEADAAAEAAEARADKEMEAADREMERADKEMEAADKNADKEDDSDDQDAAAAHDRSRRDADKTRGRNHAEAKTKADANEDVIDADVAKSLSGIGDEIGRQFKNGFPGQDTEFSRQIGETVQNAVTQALQEAAQAMEEGGSAQKEADQAIDEAFRSLKGTRDQNQEARQSIESARRESRAALQAARRALQAAVREIERVLRELPKASEDDHD